MCYFVFSDSDIMSKKVMMGSGNNKEILNMVDNSQIDPSILKKIPDNINIGFEPFDDLEDD